MIGYKSEFVWKNLSIGDISSHCVLVWSNDEKLVYQELNSEFKIASLMLESVHSSMISLHDSTRSLNLSNIS